MITARVRTVDAAQYEYRLKQFDFDMTVGLFSQSLSPGNEQVDFFASVSADTPGSRNLAGIRDPAVDRLVDLVIAAPDRAALVARTRALDRVLLSGPLPHPAVPPQGVPRGLLGPLRPAGGRAEVRARLRYVVGRPARAAERR